MKHATKLTTQEKQKQFKKEVQYLKTITVKELDFSEYAHRMLKVHDKRHGRSYFI